MVLLMGLQWQIVPRASRDGQRVPFRGGMQSSSVLSIVNTDDICSISSVAPHLRKMVQSSLADLLSRANRGGGLFRETLSRILLFGASDRSRRRSGGLDDRGTWRPEG